VERRDVGDKGAVEGLGIVMDRGEEEKEFDEGCEDNEGCNGPITVTFKMEFDPKTPLPDGTHIKPFADLRLASL